MLLDNRKVVIKSDEKRQVFAEVYAPLQVDSDGETMTAEEIEKMAHRFLKEGKVAKIDVGHDYEESGCFVIESFIVRKNDPDGFREGAWVLGVHIIPDALWAAVKKGEINCFSFGGVAKGASATVKLSAVKSFEGVTEKSDEDGIVPEHKHKFNLKFDDSGNVVNGRTSVASSHYHIVIKISATNSELDHSHRILTID